MKISGVYRIKNKINGKVYIGSSLKGIFGRWRNHISALNRNAHVNEHLQNAWNKYGAVKFKFETIESVLVENKEYLLGREQWWMDKYESYNPKKGHNGTKTAGCTVLSEEAKRKISEKTSGENCGTAKLTWEKVRKIRKEYKDVSFTKLAKKHGVTLSTISAIIHGKNWKDEAYSFEGLGESRQGKMISKGRKGLCKGKNHPCYGKPISESRRKRLSELNTGEKHPSAKMTAEQVIEIRRAYDSGERICDLMRKYDVGKGCVSGIVYRKTWKHLKD